MSNRARACQVSSRSSGPLLTFLSQFRRTKRSRTVFLSQNSQVRRTVFCNGLELLATSLTAGRIHEQLRAKEALEHPEALSGPTEPSSHILGGKQRRGPRTLSYPMLVHYDELRACVLQLAFSLLVVRGSPSTAARAPRPSPPRARASLLAGVRGSVAWKVARSVATATMARTAMLRCLLPVLLTANVVADDYTVKFFVQIDAAHTGEFAVTVREKKAPIAARRFREMVNSGFFDGCSSVLHKAHVSSCILIMIGTGTMDPH